MPSQSSKVPGVDKKGVKKRNANLETKSLTEKLCFLDNFSQRTQLKIFAQPEGQKNNENMPRVIRRQPLEATFLVMRVEISCREGQKQFKILALHLKRTFNRPTIYNGAYPEKMWIALPGNPMGVTKPSLIILFVQPDKKTLEESTSLQETLFLIFFGKKSRWKVHLASIQNPLFYTFLKMFHNSADMHILRRAERAKL